MILKNIINKNLIIFIGFLLVPLFSLAVENEMIINQFVDNSCNENRICEIDLGETVYTCPTDCHFSHVTPQALLEMNQGYPIKISNVKFTAISEDQITISWETNKPTSDNLVFIDGMGGTEEEYLDSFYTINHSVILKDFDVNKEYYFRIFSQGTHGDDNFEVADLFVLRVADIEDFEDVIKKAEQDEILIDYEIFIDKRIQHLCEANFDLNEELMKICKIEPPEKERFKNPKRPVYYDNHFLYDWGYAFKQFLYKIYVLKRGRISIRDYLSVFN